MKIWLLGATALAGGAMFAAGAMAQTAPNAPTTAQEAVPTSATPTPTVLAAAADDDGQIVVTGSRIRRANLDSTVPVLSISGTEFFESGSISIGDTLNDLPQLRSTFSQQNSTRFLGTRGLNLLDLRGLGTQRTLVLVNGRRHVAGDVLVNAVSPDINTFPTDLIERFELTTGGNSSIYGSDAIAGVVNFILKDNYEGFQVRGQAGLSAYGDAGNYYVSALAGKNFSDGRGNIAVNVEYAKSDRYFGSNRPNLRQNDAFIVVDTDPAGSVNGSDGNPDRVFFRDIRSATISPGGQLGFQQLAGTSRCGADSAGGAFTCGFLFQPDGTLIPQTGARVGLAPNGNYIGGNGQTGRAGELLTLSPDLERISFNALGKFEFSPAFVAFFEAKYVRSDAFGSVSGPFFSQGQTLGDGIAVAGLNDRSFVARTAAGGNGPVNREGIRLDNPFLTAQARTVITREAMASVNAGVNPNTGAALTNNNATTRDVLLSQIADGSFRFASRRNYVDLGIRDEDFRRETYRGVVGVRGEFNDDWTYEISANYGEHRERNVIAANVNRQRFLLASDTTRNAAGAIVCRSQVDPAYAGSDRGGNPAILAADIAACVPLNPFGEGSTSQALRDYLTIQSEATGKITQFVAQGFMAGDTSQFFELPGGPVGFSAGGEYRRETVSYDLDDLTQAGYAFYNAIPSFTAPAFEVKEAFAELSVPLLKDIPFFQELTLSGSGRYSEYNGATGGVWTYAGGVSWRPIQDLRFRGAYSRAIRAPNLSELFSAQGQNFAPAPNDPCSARNLATGSATRAANCTAAGRPSSYDFVYTSSLEVLSGGNPDLTEETSTSITIGGVFTPSFVPGLSISVDYYDIEVEDTISTVTTQQILNSCYDAADLNNAFCALIQRTGPGGGPRGEQEFRLLEGTLLASSLNFAKLTARGIDTEIAYRNNFEGGSAGFRVNWTHVLERNDFTNLAEPNRANQILGELGDPRDQVNLNADVRFGPVTVGYQLRWIDSMFTNTFEDFNSIQGRPAENADFSTPRRYPAVTYQDARIAMDVADGKFNLYLGIDNITDTKPPFGLTGVGAGSGIYDVRGRYFYAGFIAKIF